MKVLVIPTIREKHAKEFLEAWRSRKDWDEIIVVEDNPTKSFDIQIKHHYAWDDVEQTLQDDSWIISRRDSAIRSFGFLMAYRLGAKYIFTLDDDCYPIDDGKLCETHIAQMKRPKWVESIPGKRTRGLPYFNKGELDNVVANMGLWLGVQDHDAVQTMSYGVEKLDVPTEKVSRIIPRGQYFPFCGMNFAFKAEVAVLSYFPLMGEGQPYRRFDDIWFGIILKKICDHLNLGVSVGPPFVWHERASDPMTNLVKEAPGIKFNEIFWEMVDKIELSGRTPNECMKEMGKALNLLGKATKDKYIENLGEAISVWTTYFPQTSS